MDNETLWKETLGNVKQYMDANEKRPSKHSDDDNTKRLGQWISHQIYNYKNKNDIMKDNEYIRGLWKDFINDPKYRDLFIVIDDVKKWKENFQKVSEYIEKNNKRPSASSKDKDTKILGSWISTQIQNYKNRKKIMKEENIKKLWKDFINEYKKYFKTSKKSMARQTKSKEEKSKEELLQRKERVKSEISVLHQKYKSMNSQNLHKLFEEQPEDWTKYHKLAEANEESFPEDEIPYKKIIAQLETIPGKRKKVVVDMGCGKARIHQAFKDNPRFTFHNFDHIACNELVTAKDMKNTELDDYSVDIVIFSLSMWGSNCKEYITEAHKILDSGGKIYIIEPYKRWWDEEKQKNRLIVLLEDNEFKIIKKIENKFMFIECQKN